MSGTLSIGKTGPGLDSFEPEPSPSSISTLLRRPRRVSPTLVFAVLYPPVAHLCAGQSVATAGVTSVDSTVSCRGWRLGRSQKKSLGFAPTASDQTAGWDGSRYVGTAFPKASRSRPCGLSPSTSMRARGPSRRWPCSCGRRAPASVDVHLKVVRRDCGGNPGPKPSYAARPKSLRYCMGLL